MPWYDYKCKKCNTIFEITKGMNEEYLGGCPKCGCKDISRIYYPILDIWDENQNPQGCSKLMTWHEKGLDWDSPTAQRESAEIKKQGQEDGYKWAKEMAAKDEKELASKYRPVSEREAMDILKNPDRKQDVHVVKNPTKQEFSL